MNRIVVPLDGSSFSKQALPAAVGIARAAGARLALVHVHMGMPLLGYPEAGPELAVTEEDLQRAESQYLAQNARQLEEEHGLQVETALLGGAVAEAIAGWAAEWKADLIVVATHGRGGFSRLWLGSVADALLRQVSMPILLTKPDAAPGGGAGQPWVPRRMLVALDGSPFAEQILEPAAALARLAEAELVLMQVMEAPLLAEHGAELHTWPLGDEPERRYRADPEAEARLLELHRQVRQRAAEAHRYLEGVGAERLAGLRVETAVVDHARVARGILERAETSGCDLIALATHGQGGLGRFLRGSVADKVIRGAEVPLLVVRPAEQSAR